MLFKRDTLYSEGTPPYQEGDIMLFRGGILFRQDTYSEDTILFRGHHLIQRGHIILMAHHARRDTKLFRRDMLFRGDTMIFRGNRLLFSQDTMLLRATPSYSEGTP